MAVMNPARLDLGRFQADKVFNRTNGAIMSVLSLISYLPPKQQTERLDGLESFHFLDSVETGTQVSVFETKDALLVTPRGTPLELSDDPQANLQWNDIKNDLNLKPTPNYDGSGWVHSGFKNAADGIWSQVKPLLSQAVAAHKAVHFAGHSLGAAIATHLADRMHGELGVLPQSLLTVGGPSTGWAGQLHHLNRIGLEDRTVRLINNTDPVGMAVPFGSDVGHTVYFNHKGEAELGDEGHCWDKLKGVGDALLSFNFNPLQDHLPKAYAELMTDPRNTDVLNSLGDKLNG